MNRVLDIISICMSIWIGFTVCVLPIIIYIRYEIRYKKRMEYEKEKYNDELMVKQLAITEQEKTKRMPEYRDIPYDELNAIIDDIINDIWKNKYLWKYKLKEVVMIKDMNKEIEAFTGEVLSSLGKNLLHNCDKYYTHEYFVKKITRHSMFLFIEYTKENRPPIK